MYKNAVIALLLSLILLAGCASQPSDSGTPSQSAPSGGKVVIKGSNTVFGKNDSYIQEQKKPGAVPTVNASQPKNLTQNLTQNKSPSDYRSLGKLFSFQDSPEEKLHIYFFDVGYGESILVKKGEFEILFDAGPKESAQALKSKLSSLGITNLEAVAITSDDPKRWGGLSEILQSFPASEVWTDGGQHGQEFEEGVLEPAAATGIPIRHPESGDAPVFNGITFKFLFPQKQRLVGNPDINSIVLKVLDKDFCALLAGSMEVGTENTIIARGNLTCQILKVPKYGIGSSTQSNLLVSVSPKEAILSVGENDDGYPNKVVLERIRLLGIPLYRTDTEGTIEIESDGETYTVSKEN